jgi:hypothetical protein
VTKDWKADLGKVAKEMRKQRTVRKKLPAYFAFKRHNVTDFDQVLPFFDWSLRNCPVEIDFSICKSANYQALSLLVLYVMRLKTQDCTVSFKYAEDGAGASGMWRLMGALGAFTVLFDESVNFNGHEHKPLIAIRNSGDFKFAMARAEKYCEGFNVEYINTLRYVLSELLYNTIEHGDSYFQSYRGQKRLPSVIQFTWYETQREIHFLIGDLGVGVKSHLEQAYPAFESHVEALKKAIEPNVSGTFGSTNPYAAKNNQGVGLYISSNVVRKLQADMWLVSGNGVLHVSPRDTTANTIASSWPGTFALVAVRVSPTVQFELHLLMQELRDRAQNELQKKTAAEDLGKFYLSIYNIFGTRAEDKDAAIRFRDRTLLPQIEQGKVIVIDFSDVVAAPHSFLGALLATPANRLGLLAYKRLKFINCAAEIRETIDFIISENTPG